MPQVTIQNDYEGEWTRAYVDGDLVYEGHHVDRRTFEAVLEALDVELTSEEVKFCLCGEVLQPGAECPICADDDIESYGFEDDP